MKRCLGGGMGTWCGASRPPVMPLSPKLHVFTNPEALWTPPFWIFMEVSLQAWLIVIGHSLAPLPSLEVVGWGWKFHTSAWLAPLVTSPHTSLHYKRHLINIMKETPLDFHHIGNSKDLGGCEPRTLEEDQKYIRNIYLVVWVAKYIFMPYKSQYCTSLRIIVKSEYFKGSERKFLGF